MSTGYTRLFIWIEGNDDERFVESVIIPRLRKKYQGITTIKYAQRNKKWKLRYIRTIKAMNADYIYLEDLHGTPCVTSKKGVIRGKLIDIDEERIFIVVKEIEGWYLAGLDTEKAHKLKLRRPRDTNSLTKYHFNRLLSQNFDSRIDCLIEMLKSFSFKEARRRNVSFQYFLDKNKL